MTAITTAILKIAAAIRACGQVWPRGELNVTVVTRIIVRFTSATGSNPPNGGITNCLTGKDWGRQRGASKKEAAGNGGNSSL